MYASLSIYYYSTHIHNVGTTSRNIPCGIVLLSDDVLQSRGERNQNKEQRKLELSNNVTVDVVTSCVLRERERKREIL